MRRFQLRFLSQQSEISLHLQTNNRLVEISNHGFSFPVDLNPLIASILRISSVLACNLLKEMSNLALLTTNYHLIMTLKEILADPGISSWLKDAIKTAYERDTIEAMRDANRLLTMLRERYTQTVNRNFAYRT